MRASDCPFSTAACEDNTIKFDLPQQEEAHECLWLACQSYAAAQLLLKHKLPHTAASSEALLLNVVQSLRDKMQQCPRVRVATASIRPCFAKSRACR